MSENKILLVEDEITLAEGLEYNLQAEGFSVILAIDGKQAIEKFKANDFDLIVLDIMLPYIDGFEVARQVREISPQIPILMLTARTTIQDKIQGLEIGADDYLTKPFHLEEFLIRVKGMLKRKNWYSKPINKNSIYRFGKNQLNFDDLSCENENGKFHLTQREAMVMKYFIEKKDIVVSRSELLENVWNINSEVETRTVDNFIARLRKYFEPNPKKPIYIKSVRSAGYIFSD